MGAPLIIESTTGSANNGGNATLTLGVLRDDYIVVTATRGTSRTGAMTVASSSGGTYTNLLGTTLQSSSCQFSVWGHLVTGSEAPSIQAVISGTGNSSDSCCAVASVWRFVRSSNPFDGAIASTTGNSSLPDSPAATLIDPDLDEVVITAIGQQATGVTLTPPSTYTSLGTVSVNDNWDSAGGQAYIILTSTAATVDPATWTSTLSAGWASATIVLASFDPMPHAYFLENPVFYRTTEIIGY